MTQSNYQQTSREAFDKVKEVQPSYKDKIVEQLAKTPNGYTRSELVAAIGGPDETIQPALSTLSASGKVIRTGERRQNAKGNNENVYALNGGTTINV